MGSVVVKEQDFPEIVIKYNNEGKAAAYSYLRDKYHVKNPFVVIRRIKRSDRYNYDMEADRFVEPVTMEAENVFMDLDELCGTAVSKQQELPKEVTDGRPMAMEKLIHELISDRLLTLSKYIMLDSTTRTILIDQTSLSADGYQIVTH